MLAAARSAGATIIHAPSGCMAHYEGTAARARAAAAQPVGPLPPGIDEWQV